MFWIIPQIGGLVSLITNTFVRNENSPVFGVYRGVTGLFILKFIFIFLILSFRKVWRFIRMEEDTTPPRQVDGSFFKAGGYGSKSRSHPIFMDCVQSLSSNPKAIDAVYFNGASAKGWNLIAAIARRPKGVVNGMLILRIPGIGLLMQPRSPSTFLFQDEEIGEFSAEGLELKPVVPMRAWNIKYHGFLKVVKTFEHSPCKPGELVRVDMEALWSSQWNYFDFDTDMSPTLVASAMAREPWSRDYFDKLKSKHQTHYEQFGELNGTVVVNEQSFKLSLSTVRDHSYGEKREWKDFHRYALHYFTMEDGTKFCLGAICIPSMFSRLNMGYVYTPTGEIYPVESTSFTLYHHGEGGTPPSDYGFTFFAGGKYYDVQVLIDETCDIFFGWEWEAKVIEGFGKVIVNGIRGWGAIEYEYRHLGGRPESETLSDPDWTVQLIK